MSYPNYPKPGVNYYGSREPKFFVSRVDGKHIPEDEPYFVIRGQDAFAMKVVQKYIDLTLDIVDPDLTLEMLKHREDIRIWQANNRDKVKIPD